MKYAKTPSNYTTSRNNFANYKTSLTAETHEKLDDKTCQATMHYWQRGRGSKQVGFRVQATHFEIYVSKYLLV
jgi:hypothetical protein